MRFFIYFIVFFLTAQNLAANPLIVFCLDNLKSSDLDKCKFLTDLKQKGISSPGLEPVFPVKSFPNLITISTGLYPVNHGIIANNFKDFHLGEYYSISDTSITKNPDWYHGRLIWEWAKQFGKITAGFNWPATNLNSYKRKADISVNSEDSTLSDFVISMVSGETFSKADIVLIYLNNQEIFNYKENSKEYNKILVYYDDIIKNTFQNLNVAGINDFNYMVLSTGGLEDISNGDLISIENELNSSKNLIVQNYGSFMILDGNQNEIDIISKKLKTRNGISTYLKPNYPDEFNYQNSPLTGKALVIADPGNLIINESMEQSNLPIKNANGYLPRDLNMHGVFIAGGADIKSLKTGTIKTIDIFALMCELLKVPLPNNIDSKPERINFILK